MSRLLAVHGRYLPSEPASFRQLVDLYSDDGLGPLPTEKLRSFLEESILFDGTPTPTEIRRAIASAALFTAYALRGWDAAENHLAVAQGWLVFSLVVLRIAEEQSVRQKDWEPSYELAFDAAAAALERLTDEAANAKDLSLPDLAEGAFYGTRALLVCGYASALFLAKRLMREAETGPSKLLRLLRREFKYVRVLGESAAPYMFAVACAVTFLESAPVGESIIERYTRALLHKNQPDGQDALADPYHSVGEMLARSLDLETDEQLSGERIDGRVFTARPLIEALARRLRRQSVASLWPAYTRVVTCEFVPSVPSRLLTIGDDDGILDMRMPKQPGSWNALRADSLMLDKSELPSVVWVHPEILPLLPLVLPPRFTTNVVRAIDYLLFPSRDYSVLESMRPVAERSVVKKKRRSTGKKIRSDAHDPSSPSTPAVAVEAPRRRRKK